MAICSMIPNTISMFRGIHSWVNDGLVGQNFLQTASPLTRIIDGLLNHHSYSLGF